MNFTVVDNYDQFNELIRVKGSKPSYSDISFSDNNAEIDYINEDGKPNITLVDFSARWCGPCKQIGPIFQDLASKYVDKINFIKVDIGEDDRISENEKIESIPTFKLYYNGIVVDQFTHVGSFSISRNSDGSRISHELNNYVENIAQKYGLAEARLKVTKL